MPYSRFVEIGRVALITFGPDKGKLVVIVDVVDDNKAVVDAPTENVNRHVITLRRIALTAITIQIPRQARLATLKKAWDKAEVTKQWENSSWAKKMAVRETRSKLNDFDRFKTMVLKKKKRLIVKRGVAQLKKEAK